MYYNQQEIKFLNKQKFLNFINKKQKFLNKQKSSTGAMLMKLCLFEQNLVVDILILK